jgi:hypothetical protein
MKKPQKNYNSKIELGILIAFLGILLISTQANACCWPTRKSVIPAEDPLQFRVVSPLHLAKQATKAEIPVILDAENPCNVNGSTPTMGDSLCDKNPSGNTRITAGGGLLPQNSFHVR